MASAHADDPAPEPRPPAASSPPPHSAAPPPPARRAARARQRRISGSDRELLGFAAVHRLVRLDHVERLLGLSSRSARRHLTALTGLGMLRQDVAVPGPLPCWQITRAGLRLIDVRMHAPKAGQHAFAHEVGMAWLWLAAREGRFGAVREVMAERELRSRDRAGRRSNPPLAVRLGGAGRHGLARLHYADLLLITAAGQRVAVELELTSKSRPRREAILAGYGADPTIDAVLYLVDQRSVGTAIINSARRLGISSRVIVQAVDMRPVWEVSARARKAERPRAGDRIPERGRAPDGLRSRGPTSAPGRERSPGFARSQELER